VELDMHSSPLTRSTTGRLKSAGAWSVGLLFLCATVTACDPSSGSGCRRVSSFVLQESFPIVAYDITILAAKPKPEGQRDERRFNCTKQDSPQWARTKSYKGSIRSNGKSGKNARYYEWDNTHNDIEVYGPSPKYKHLGSMDPITGRLYKDPVKERDLRDKLK
jgi:hypothetical protein